MRNEDFRDDIAGLAAARRKARWELGDSSWADVILSAYFNPEQANEDLNAEMGDD